MSPQPTLWDAPRARTSDPRTSHAAAARASKSHAPKAIAELMADGRPRILAEVQAALSWFRPDTTSSAWSRAKSQMTRTGTRNGQEEWAQRVQG